MIGFVYADYYDIAIEDGFHRSACAIFQEISIQFPNEISSLTDPSVTDARLWRLFQECEFVFYWGHGLININREPVLFGSNENEYLSVSRIGKEFSGKQFFLDGCSIASEMNNLNYPDILVIAPVSPSSYNTSVLMGCHLIFSLFEMRMFFDEAFLYAAKQTKDERLYRLIGAGLPARILVSENARACVVRAFTDLLGIWNGRNKNAR